MNTANILHRIRQWVVSSHGHLATGTDYTRGYAAGIGQAKDIIGEILEDIDRKPIAADDRTRRVQIVLDFDCTDNINARILADTILSVISEECDPDGEFIPTSAAYIKTTTL